MLEARDRINDFLSIEKESDHASERADSYLVSMKHLRNFLDVKYPTLAKDWGNKAISNAYLKTDFKNWMKIQKKSNGEPYSNSTITIYTNALKSATSKLNLVDINQTDLFYYTSYETFEEAHNIIKSAPNFNDVDVATSNRSYSSAMILYSRFLKEISEPSCWIFQGNPKYYDVIGAVNVLDNITWAVNQYTKQIKGGDKAYIWISGSEGGIIAAGTIILDPETREPETDDPFLRGGSLNTAPYLAVNIKIERKMTSNIVLRKILLADERTKRLEILKYPGATNFKVTKEQDAVIESIINGNYERVPPTGDDTVIPAISKKRYWIYAPGEGSSMWEEFYNKSIMGIGWDEIGDLSRFPTKESMKDEMKKVYGVEYSYKNDGHATWQFANEVNPGDVVFVKRGLSKIVGRGVVKSEYIFDSSRDVYRNVHMMDWTHKGEWDHPGQSVMKTLTNITPYTDYCKRLEDIFVTSIGLGLDDEQAQYESYTPDDFLSDVYMSEERYVTLKNLLLKKKNIILQGAPGVGKTYAAERLAHSIMEEKDTSRVMVVQFHQSYSYEDFIMGYRPSDSGFSLTKGPFYSFCKEAEPDDREYFFIIDEINRGNLSKIFGELLMLIENDKRGKEVRLLYSDEQFSVPENVHIIGMMNTADRSLAMIDYALRRRFAFFEFEPAFDTEGFKTYQSSIANRKFDNVIETVISMNKAISEDASLGRGFRVGHSYFCTDDIVDDAWLSDLVEYELLPLIREYWFDESSKVEHWALKLRGAVHG
ncbi:MAG: GTPase subunit of restriction endonuclease [Firmicutes bacterium]|nr:GTPase subunit of restriction endonuclease [Bacillota bacterium]